MHLRAALTGTARELLMYAWCLNVGPCIQLASTSWSRYCANFLHTRVKYHQENSGRTSLESDWNDTS
eukprot:3490728-Amphidinium_carterae.1